MKKSLILACVLGFACATCAFAAPKKTVLVYSSMQEDQLLAIKTAFEKTYPGITMEYYFAGTGKVMAKIAAEVGMGQVEADLLWVGDPTNYIIFKEQGILEQYSSPEADRIDPVFIDPEGYYTGARMMNMGIAFNTLSVSPEEVPETWEELLDPKWNDQIVMTDPNTAGTTKYWVDAMMANPKYGSLFMEGLKANKCHFENGTTTMHNQIASGAYKLGIGVDYVTENLASDDSFIEFAYPEDTVSIFSPIGLVKGSSVLEEAKLLYDFILSKEGQKILVACNLLSVRSDVTQTADVLEIASKAMESDMAEVVAKQKENRLMFDKIFR